MKPLRKPRTCPIEGCKTCLDKPNLLMCAKHWYRVPKTLRDRIWNLFRTKQGSAEHRRACLEAILHVSREEKKSA